MTKITTNETEWYPVYTFRVVEGERSTDEIEVDQDTLEKWASVFGAFNLVQQEIRKAIQYAQYIRNLPKMWWSIIIRTGTTYERYGFHGNKVDATNECDRAKAQYVGCGIERYEASNKHSLEYQRSKEQLRNKEDDHDQIQEDLSL